MSFQRHGQIYQSDVLFRPRSEAVSGFAPGLIVLMSLLPAIPRQVGLHQSPPPLHRLKVILIPSAETVNHHPARAGEFSTGEMRNFQPPLTDYLNTANILYYGGVGSSGTYTIPADHIVNIGYVA